MGEKLDITEELSQASKKTERGDVREPFYESFPVKNAKDKKKSAEYLKLAIRTWFASKNKTNFDQEEAERFLADHELKHGLGDTYGKGKFALEEI